jgi:3-oxoadipate enol-lactonase
VLLLSNSLGTDMEMWRPQLAQLSRDFRVLRYDQRGHGQSDAPVGAYSIDRLARDVLELLDALGLGVVDYCGLSLGGMVGQALAVRAGERLRRLVLANTSSSMGPPSAWDARITQVGRDGMTSLADASIVRWFTPDFVEAAPQPVAVVRDMLLHTSPTGYAGCCAAIRDMDLGPVLPLIAVPTLVISGRADPATPPAHAEKLRDRIAQSRLVELDGAHLSNVEAPAAFARAVSEFLTA